MSSLQKMGGVAALIMATIYLVGFVVFFILLNPGGPLDSIEQVAFLAEKETTMYLTILFLYVVGGFILVVLVQALYERLKVGSPAVMQSTAVIGFIWAAIVIVAGMIYVIGLNTVVELYDTDPAQAATVWLTVGIVFQGLGGGTEIVGGLWTLLISWVALRKGEFPKVLNYIGLVVGVAGIVTIIPALEDLTAVFGLGQIPWFIWLGIILLRSNQTNQRVESDHQKATGA